MWECPVCNTQNEGGKCERCGTVKPTEKIQANQPVNDDSQEEFRQPLFENQGVYIPQYTTSEAVVVKKSKAPFIITICVVLAILIIAAAFIPMIMPKKDIYTDLLDAFKRSFIDSGSFMLTGDSDGETAEGKIALDMENSKLYVDLSSENERIVLYGDDLYVSDNGSEYYTSGVGKTINSALEVVKDVENGSNTKSFKGIMEESFGKFYIAMLEQQGFSFEEAENCIKEFNDCMKNKEWAEKYLGLVKSNTSAGTVYEFNIDVSAFVQEVFRIFRPMFGETLASLFDDQLPDIPAETFNLSITIKNRYISGVSATLEGRVFTLKFSDFGEIKFDSDEYTKFMKEAEEKSYDFSAIPDLMF
ncbi:MAG: hypothetical protein DBX47_07540 [Clostridiales bacterium]|nr:MAG: hypothetical protein DBX47_07540 [Clostridiales bacterium]